jgi:hypothetical protein
MLSVIHSSGQDLLMKKNGASIYFAKVGDPLMTSAKR